MEIAFSKALIIFAAALATLFFVLLIKAKDGPRENNWNIRWFEATSLLAATVGAAAAFLTIFTPLRETPVYYTLLVVDSALIMISSLGVRSRRVEALLVFSILALGTSITMGQIPSAGMSVGEGEEMIVSVLSNGRWSFGAAHNPSYNPIPTVALDTAFLSYLTSVPWFSWYLSTAFNLALIVGYGLVVYALGIEVTDNKLASIVSVLFVFITPQTDLLQDPYQWSGSLLVMISLLMLVKMIKRRSLSLHLSMVLDLSFVGAILSHPTAAIFGLVPIASLLAAYSLRRLRFNDITIRGIMIQRTHLIVLALLVLTITLTRAVFTFGYLNYILPMVSNFVGQVFFPPETRSGGFSPLFDRVGVSPIQAYSWAIAISLSAALVAAWLLKRRISSLQLSLFLSAGIFILAGYGIGALFKVVASTAMYRGTYVAIPFIFPLAGLAVATTLRGGRALAAISLILLLLAVPIASHDPNVSPIQYAAIHGSPIARISPNDVQAAHDLYPLLAPASAIAVRGGAESGNSGTTAVNATLVRAYSQGFNGILSDLAVIHGSSTPPLFTAENQTSLSHHDRVFDTGTIAVYAA